jgi:hypothetical protein
MSSTRRALQVDEVLPVEAWSTKHGRGPHVPIHRTASSQPTLISSPSSISISILTICASHQATSKSQHLSRRHSSPIHHVPLNSPLSCRVPSTIRSNYIPHFPTSSNCIPSSKMEVFSSTWNSRWYAGRYDDW